MRWVRRWASDRSGDAAPPSQPKKLSRKLGLPIRMVDLRGLGTLTPAVRFDPCIAWDVPDLND
jgi:hypothetical protein